MFSDTAEGTVYSEWVEKEGREIGVIRKDGMEVSCKGNELVSWYSACHRWLLVKRVLLAATEAMWGGWGLYLYVFIQFKRSNMLIRCAAPRCGVGKQLNSKAMLCSIDMLYVESKAQKNTRHNHSAWTNQTRAGGLSWGGPQEAPYGFRHPPYLSSSCECTTHCGRGWISWRRRWAW